MRRLLAAAGVAALSLAVVVPVALANVPNGQTSGQQMAFYTPTKTGNNGQSIPQPDTPPDGASVSASSGQPCQYHAGSQTAQCEITVHVHLFSSADSNQPGGGVQSWSIQIVPAAGGPASTCTETISPQNGSYQDDAYLLCPWDTTRAYDRTLPPDNPTTPTGQVGSPTFERNWQLADKGPAVNGAYQIQVTATSAGQHCVVIFGCKADLTKSVQYQLYEDPGNQRWRQVYVTNGVSAPSGVNATLDQPSNQINVTWAPNPEPDVTYLVQEKVGGGNWAAVGTVPASATNYVRTVSQPGKYQYQVAAMRPEPTASNTSATETSNYVAAQAVTVSAVSTTTTAAAGSGAPGAPAGPNGPGGTIDHSDDNGVAAPGGSTSTTAVGSHVAGSAKGGAAAAHATGSTSGGGAAADSEAAGEGPDTGFASTLPYQDPQNGSVDGLGSGNSESPESMSNLVNVPRPQGARALLIPLAGALAMFVLAAQGMYLIRRRTPVTAGGAMVEDDFDDWMGY